MHITFSPIWSPPGIAALIIAETDQLLIAKALNLHVRLVPHGLFDAIRTATGLDRRPPRNTAIRSHAGISPRFSACTCASFCAPAPQPKQLALF
jgi:hypothetical protein